MQIDMQKRAIAGAAILMGCTLAMTPAALAGEAGDCCADLEARITELEATTARKGNRKVSVTISGWVNEAIFAWDDGVERNAYIGTNFVEQSRFRFVGDAKINKERAPATSLRLACRDTHRTDGTRTISPRSTLGLPTANSR
jgi:hypothetical protein